MVHRHGRELPRHPRVQRALGRGDARRPDLLSRLAAAAFLPFRAAGAGAGPYHLLGRDKGDYAIYRLRPGEALYSSVVVRFTGRVFAGRQRARGGHRTAQRYSDVTDIPIGYPVQHSVRRPAAGVPARGAPGRAGVRGRPAGELADSATRCGRKLAGITVILDAGHGGQDGGASMGGVWESLYVYDIVMRTKTLLGADRGQGLDHPRRQQFRVADRDVLPFSRGHAVLTTPPYPIEDPAVGVQSALVPRQQRLPQGRRAAAATRQGGLPVDPRRLAPPVAARRHGLHPRPPACATTATARPARSTASRKEVQERPRVDLPVGEAGEERGAVARAGQADRRRLPGRGPADPPVQAGARQVIRDKGSGCRPCCASTRCRPRSLLEVCNLGNDQDRSLIQTRAYRQHVAQARSSRELLAYYGEDGARPTVPSDRRQQGRQMGGHCRNPLAPELLKGHGNFS